MSISRALLYFKICFQNRTELSISSLTPGDIGNYTCSAAKDKSVTIQFVIIVVVNIAMIIFIIIIIIIVLLTLLNRLQIVIVIKWSCSPS